jgi:hypothetical protein
MMRQTVNSTVQNTEFSPDLMVQERHDGGALRHYFAILIILASIPACLAWNAFLFWLVIRIFGVL